MMNGGCQSHKISENLFSRAPPVDLCYNGASLRFQNAKTSDHDGTVEYVPINYL